MKFNVRAVQIDLARQIETVDTVKKFFDVCAGAGMNTVLMYLEDRVKTKTYPYSPDEESYSPDQIRDMVAYADTLGLDLIPVVSPIGHTGRFLRHPEMKHLAELRGGIAGMFSPAGDEHYRVTCSRLPETLAFFDAYITEVASLFPSKFFHLGFDEIHDMGYCELCKGTSVADLFYDALMHFHDLLKGLGKDTMIWDDMMEQIPGTLERLPRDIVLCPWFYEYVGQYPVARFDTSRSYDYFSYYERLGFRYLASPWRRGSVDTVTEYAAKCHPMGMLMTNWEMSDYQLLPLLYPRVDYAGALWTGKELPGNEARIHAAKKYTDTSEAAKAMSAAMSTVMGFDLRLPAEKGVYNVPSADVYGVSSAIPVLADILEKATGDADVIDSHVVRLHHLQAQTNLWRTGYALHEYRAGDGALTLDEIRVQIGNCRNEVAALRNEETALWNRCRTGIASPALERGLKAMETAVEYMGKTAATATAEDIGRLVVRFELPEFTSSCKTRITVNYADGTSYEAGYGIFKAGDVHQVQYDYSFEIPAKVPQSVTLSVSGFGASGFRYVSAILPGKKCYVPAGITAVAGQVEHPEFMLTPDSRASMFNEQEMVQFFVNENSAHKDNTVTVAFKEW